MANKNTAGKYVSLHTTHSKAEEVIINIIARMRGDKDPKAPQVRMPKAPAVDMSKAILVRPGVLRVR